MSDKFHEECGVIGIWRGEKNASIPVYYGLYALQHRGQESAGIAANFNGEIDNKKGSGLAGEVFKGENFSDLKGNIAIGHVRYSTAGGSNVRSAQPLVARCRLGDIALAHNGNLVNADSLKSMLTDQGMIFHTSSDSESILNLICQYGNSRGIESGIKNAMNLMKGAYVLVITLENKLIGVRDPYGLHPLCIGKLPDGYILSSESCALESLDAEFMRDVLPGEIVIIDQDGIKSIKPSQWCKKSLCVFELVYFARPDSILDGISVYDFRRRCGMLLARQNKNKINADLVMAIPDSGTPAAIGYAEESGIPYGEGLIKNKYMGRTFIQPTQEMREDALRIKLAVIKKNIENKKLIVIDDSIVRGTTIKRIVKNLRDAGASEIHVCAASPAVKFSCYFGIDTPYRDRLIAVQKSSENEICEYIGADSLTYLSESSLREACGEDLYCKACFDGNYPMEVPINSDMIK